MRKAITRISAAILLGCIAALAAGCPAVGPVRPGVEPKPNVDPIFGEARGRIFLIGNDAAGPMGTAFLLNYHNRDYLVTNFHVISQIKDLYVETEKKVKYAGIKVLAVDRFNDVALLDASALAGQNNGLHPTHNFVTSQKVFVIGFPNMRSKENHLNFVTGVISDANYMAPPLMGKGVSKNIQITAPVNPGNSGSPVLNERAEVIGVVSWRFAKETDIQAGNYAVPFQFVSTLITEAETRTQSTAQLYPGGGPCGDDEDCLWLYFCREGKCRPLADVGEKCSVHDDCYLPYYCNESVCTKIGAPGDACQDDSQCAPPNYCILGHCGPLREKGESCAIDIDCVMPLYCIVGKCVSGLSDLNAPCAQTVDCKAPLVCSNGTCQQIQCTSDSQCYPLFCILGACRALGNKGDPCGQTIDCKAGMQCTGGTCKASALSPIGGPCKTDFDCQMPWYCLGGTCKEGSMAPKSNVPGSACTSDVQCKAPLYCILIQCRTLGCEGDACAIDADCNFPFVCKGGKCIYEGPPPGQPCQSDSDCPSPLYCILGQCRTLGCEGDACAQTMDCLSPFVCTGGVCTNPPPPKPQPDEGPKPTKKEGEHCKADEECVRPLTCDKGKCSP